MVCRTWQLDILWGTPESMAKMVRLYLSFSSLSKSVQDNCPLLRLMEKCPSSFPPATHNQLSFGLKFSQDLNNIEILRSQRREEQDETKILGKTNLQCCK